jgi:uncharacterized protein YcbX
VQVGRILELWRYPVKSMGGESLASAAVGAAGLPGDRAWALRDEQAGEIRGAKKIPGLLHCRARYPAPPGEIPSPPAEIALPDGTTLLSTAPGASKRLSEALEREVTLWPLVPKEDLAHYRRGQLGPGDPREELRAIFGRTPDEPLPDLSRFPRELFQYTSPPGTYFDAYPLLLLTDASVATVRAAAPDSAIDVRRFRPNLFVAADAGRGLVELEWIGRRLRIGSLVLAVRIDCPRCVMVTHGFDDLPTDPRVMRAVVSRAQGSLGVYATVEEPGAVSVGDAVELLDAY